MRRREAGLGETCKNPFRSIVVRAVEVLYACDEALRIIDDYQEPERAASRPDAACRRRLRLHRGAARHAVPPLSAGCGGHDPRCQDRAADVAEPAEHRGRSEDFAGGWLDMPEEALRVRCEQAVRNHDPCISCATHFLKLEVVRG